MTGQRIDAAGHRIRQQLVVGIEKDDELSARRDKADVAGGSDATVGLANDLGPMAIRGQACVVRRAIVHNDRFKGLIVLPARASDCGGKESRLVVAGDDNTHQRARHLTA